MLSVTTCEKIFPPTDKKIIHPYYIKTIIDSGVYWDNPGRQSVPRNEFEVNLKKKFNYEWKTLGDYWSEFCKSN